MSEFIKCPIGDATCPYLDANGNCMMYPDTHPQDGCDEYSLMVTEIENTTHKKKKRYSFATDTLGLL